MFTPHVTVACVVQAEGHFLVVEEWVNDRLTWNQPAGHLEADETLLHAAQRELREETGLDAVPQSLLQIHQWIAPDRTPFIRFLFALDLPARCTTAPQDPDISGCHWVRPGQVFAADNLRSPLVAESLRRYQQPERFPLALLSAFNWPFGDAPPSGAC
ncbi:NUDIX domain-containing protein [Pantoea sp. 1.19]|uniref:NUDIX domain-containing protein n=1 Tax=Pantoea sp. 1.19 TaxID=1925589 RepID=UPI0009488CA8|nr:NUDIX hydrolase [Pantoea sp. 1.19]